jgi:methylated-DNA-[protein]-cysteine S-methyltransferase
MRVVICPPEVPNAGPVKTDLKDPQPAGCAEIDEIADLMEAFLNGADIRFPLDSILLELCSEFQQQVLRAEHGIPRGKVSTYQLIAAFLGKPSGARAVGNALATNPFPIIIPCHRAIRGDRTLGGYQGGLQMKRALLEAEGIAFDQTGRVAVADFHYSSGLGR